MSARSHEDTAEVSLLDGTIASIRPISPADASALWSFHESLSRDSQRLRFFSVHPHLRPVEVDRFTHVDHSDREAFVAIVDHHIVGVGRYDRVAPDRAEIAFVVADAWHGRGIATLLLDRLATRARAVGVDRFVADSLAENRAMRDVFRHWGTVDHTSFDAGVVHSELPL